MKSQEAFKEVLNFLARLNQAKIWHRLSQIREEALMVEVVVPGQRWEMEFLSDGEEVRVEVERFVSNGQIENEAALAELFQNFSDAEEPVADHAISGK